MRTEYEANLALAPNSTVVEGKHFRTPGRVHAYRKPSLWVRIVSFFFN